jgi:D-amino-acid dehydrogenase
MKVLVLGAGVIGITTAYFLQKEGYKVTVVDRHSESAQECSHANGAQLSYSHAEPLANWKNLWKGIKWLGKKNAPLLIRPRLDLELYKWIFKFLLECPKSKMEQHAINLLRLSFYSKQIFHELNSSLDIKYDWNDLGVLHLLSNQEALDDEVKLFELFQKHSACEYEIFSKDQCIQHEPSSEIIMKEKVGGIWSKSDEIGDAHKFTLAMQKECEKLGVEFIWNSEIISFTTNKNKITGVHTSTGFLTSNKFVCCLGAYTAKYLSPIGIKLPIYPVKGYSTSVPTGDKYNSPRSSIFDLERKIVYTRMADTLRTAGTAEFTGFDHSINEARVKPLLDATKRFFPDGGDYSNVGKWSCLRPLTPQYTSYLGKTSFANLFINAGHGFLGWTTAAGSAKVVAEIAMDKPSPISLKGFRAN